MNGYVTTKEAGSLLGVTAGRIRQFVIDGRLPAKKFGSAILIISTKDIAKFRKQRQEKPTHNGKK